MIALLLHEGGALAEPLLYLSLYLKRHRSIYYEQLDRVRSDGDWEGWVDFFLEGVEETARGAVETAQRLATLFRQDIETTQAAGRGATSALRLLTALRERPVSSLGRLSEQGEMSFPTASKAMGTLVDLGIARELTGKRRNRVFVYDTYLGILGEEGEPE
jgi:Fic family protein